MEKSVCLKHMWQFSSRWGLLCLFALQFPSANLAQAQDHTSLEQRERDLELAKEELSKDYSSQYLHERLSRLLNEVPYEKIEEQMTRGTASFTDKEREEFEGFIKYAHEWNNQQNKVQREIDQFVLDKEAFVIKKSHESLKLAMGSIAESSGISSKAKKEVQKEWKDIQKEFDKWNANQDKYGSNYDFLRNYPYKNYFQKGSELAEKLRQLTGEDKVPYSRAKDDQRPEGLRRLKLGASLIPNTVKLAWNALRPSPVSTENKTPFTLAINDFFRNRGKLKGVRTYMDGESKKLIQAGLEGKTFIVPSHLEGGGDCFALAETTKGLDSFMCFANPNAMGGGIIARKIAKQSDFVAVGTKGIDPKTGKKINYDPKSKVIQGFKDNISSYAVNYAQGITSIHNELSPPRASFAQNLIPEVQREVGAVNIIPVIHDEGSDFLANFASGGTDKDIVIKAGRPLTDKMIRVLFLIPALESDKTLQRKADAKSESGEKLADEYESVPAQNQILSRYLRAFWMENIKHHPEIELQEMLKRAERALSIELTKSNVENCH